MSRSFVSPLSRRLLGALALAATLGGAVSGPAHAHGYTVGDLKIGHPWARTTLPSQPAGGAFLKVTNQGAQADRLIGASSPVAERVELHTMKMEGDVMRMREVPAIELPAGQTVTLAPGGLHLMLIGLKGPLKVGESVPATLRFERAGTVTVDLKIEPVSGPASTHATGHDGHGTAKP